MLGVAWAAEGGIRLAGGGVELAPAFRAHRATVARWIAAAREQLLNDTRSQIRAQLDVGPDTVDSILRGVESSLEISVTRLLADDEGG